MAEALENNWRPRGLAALVAAALVGGALPVCAQTAATTTDAAASQPAAPAVWAVHVQATDVFQYHPSFNSPFAGPNSLRGAAALNNTLAASFFVGVRPWRGGQLWVDIDMNQGFAPSNTLGVAGYVNGEGAKVGHKSAYFRPQRAFFRQTIELGGGDDSVDPGLFEFGGKTTRDRLVLTVGKFGATDVFDANAYAHDPTADFLNWALIDTGTWDYAADAWGFSVGGAAEWYTGSWTLRAGLFNLSKVPNSEALEYDFSQYQTQFEVEKRFSFRGHPGAAKVTSFVTRGRMARFDDAIRLAEQTGQTPNVAQVRRYATRPGVSLDVQQELAGDLGVFLRAGVADGDHEPYEYADIDQTVAGGVALKGSRWGRARDVVGAALMVNGISRIHQRYLADGGLGILVGDGKLPHPGPEAIIETYYNWAVFGPATLSFDYQLVVNPAYNRDRGPASVLGLRVHAQY
ncbi:MAG: carbohydrate porin [Caulobacterales bacterium]